MIGAGIVGRGRQNRRCCHGQRQQLRVTEREHGQHLLAAANLAADRDRLVRLRRQLRQKSIDHGLADSWSFSRKLERAYRDMLNRLDAELRAGNGSTPRSI